MKVFLALSGIGLFLKAYEDDPTNPMVIVIAIIAACLFTAWIIEFIVTHFKTKPNKS